MKDVSDVLVPLRTYGYTDNLEAQDCSPNITFTGSTFTFYLPEVDGNILIMCVRFTNNDCESETTSSYVIKSMDKK